MHILVTGSSGTIGTRLCETLLGDGHEVRGIDWLPNKWQPAVQNITTLIDLKDRSALDAYTPFVTPDVLVHLAANARVYELVEHPERALDNFITLFNTLEYARRSGIRRFIFASSREGYGNIQADALAEDLVRVENCESPYTASKVGGEALVHAYARCYGIEAVIVRFSNVYGMYDDSVRVVPLFIRRARRHEPLTVFGKEKCLDFTYIDDAVQGIRLILEQFDRVQGETINLAYGEGNTILSLAENITSLLNSSSSILLSTPRTGEVIRYVADIGKARHLLGFRPQMDFEAGVRKAVEWYSRLSTF